MNKIITFLKLGIHSYKLFLLLLVTSFATFSYGQNYNSTTGHFYGCSWTDGTFIYNRYAAIEGVSIEDANGVVVYSKNGDGCNNIESENAGPGAHHTVIESSPAFTLNAGATYRLRFTTSNVLNNDFRSSSFAIWIDYNGDRDFDEADEFIETRTNITIGQEQTVAFTVPCGYASGEIRLRIRTNDNTQLWTSTDHSTSPVFGHGETEDFQCNYASSANRPPNFLFADSAFVNTEVNFINAAPAGAISQRWTVNGVNTTGVNATGIFNTPGSYDVKLVSRNCFGTDSVTRTITIIAPTAPPVANFASDKNVVELFQPIQLIDLSSNGPTSWNWFATNGVDTINGDFQPNLRGNLIGINNNPTIETGNYFGALDEGTWDVCLSVTNGYQGLSTSPVFCKKDFITVMRSQIEFGPSQVSEAPTGLLLDDGGRGNYLTTGGAQNVTITPCGAEYITMFFDTFDVQANVTLLVYDGFNAAAPPLHPVGGFNSANTPPDTLISSTGSLHLVWEADNNNQTAAGLVARWEAQINNDSPVANFDLDSDTIYNSTPFTLNNTSENTTILTEFIWTVNGPINATRTIRDYDAPLGIPTNGIYDVTLELTNCDDQRDTITKQIVVVPADSPTEIDFKSSTRRPNLNEDVTFTAISDKANRWEWSFFPPDGVQETTPLGDETSMERTFRFNQPGTYNVQLKGYNTTDSALSSAQIFKSAYIQIVEVCVPNVRNVSADVGISYVSIQGTNQLGNKYENTSTTGEVEYTNYSEELGTIPLDYGREYTIELRRNTTINNMTRAVWIDWNADGDFDDADEQVALDTFPNNNNSWTANFTVPEFGYASELPTTLRVGVTIDNSLNLPCGHSANINANLVGEFEDYSIQVNNDGDLPVITLNGLDTIYLEQLTAGSTTTFTTPGAIAIDPSEGDITADIIIESDLDQFLTGIYTEDYNVTDASGNDAIQVTRVIIVVEDRTAPVITLNGAADTSIEVGTTWLDPMATALDNKEGDVSPFIFISGAVNTNLVGIYTVTYQVSDNVGNSSYTTRIVRVVDTQSPIIENTSADKSGACWNVEVQLQSNFTDITTVSDNYNDLTNGLILTANPASAQGLVQINTSLESTTTVTYSATDASGNTATQCITYTVRDYIAPVIELNTLPTIEHPVNQLYTPTAATATDNIYSSTQISLISTTNVDPFTLGTYEDTYTATDLAGNVSTRVRTVNVVDNEAPVITGKNGAIFKLGVGSQFDAINQLVFTDNYDTPENLLTNVTTIFNDINLQEAGLYSYIVETTDNSGNTSAQFTLYVDVRHDYERIVASVDDVSLDDILSVSPNPTSGNINININLPGNETIDLAVYNSLGKQIEQVTDGQVKNNTYSIDLTNQANGIYYVRMNLNGSTLTKRIILNK